MGLARALLRTALDVGVLMRPSRHSFIDTGTTLTGDAAVRAGGDFCAPSSSPANPTPAVGDPACGTGLGRTLGTQFTYGLGVGFAIVPGKFDPRRRALRLRRRHRQRVGGHPLEGLLAAKVYLARNSYFEIGGGAGLLPRRSTAA